MQGNRPNIISPNRKIMLKNDENDEFNFFKSQNVIEFNANILILVSLTDKVSLGQIYIS